MKIANFDYITIYRPLLNMTNGESAIRANPTIEMGSC